MDQRARRQLLIAATAFVWTAVAAASVGRFKLAAKPGINISLATRPSTVRIAVDGERQFDGVYIDTPVKLVVPPGRHRLKISRDGYIAHLVTVEGDAGDNFRMEDVVLQKSPAAGFAVVEVVGSGGAADASPGHAEIDDAVAHGDLPLVAADLVADQPHLLTVYPKWPDRDVRFRCRFTPPVTAEDDPTAAYKIKIKITKGGKVKAAGCERLEKGGKKVK